ncbi:alpha/beta fold hydrolase [Nocardioides sp.]|uniref:alpha/beta fold hydrolase n=1 Tax=Nocardioides sp. TaxID=35761 RepID=UPI0031FE4F79|nr:putative tripeptidylaminopeptidase [Nocardioides sp.]
MTRRTTAGLVAAIGTALVSTLTGAGAPTAHAQPTAAAVAAPAYVAPPIEWTRCADSYLRQQGARCGMLIVPLDHSDPEGPTVKLAVSRIRHTTATASGVMFTNPGGPGGSGRWMATLGASVPHGVGGSFDWYGMDPRGVGDSLPRLTCDRGYFDWDRPAYVPSSATIMRQWRARTEAYAAACGRAGARRLLPHLRTVDTVADFETLREAIGAETVGFYGGSYGTYIAQVYATLHPASLDRVVMDGVIDPTRVFYRANLDQDRAFQGDMDAFFGWLGQHPRQFHLGSSKAAVKAAYRQLQDRLADHPVDRVGPSELTDALLPAGYGVRNWPFVGQQLSRLVVDNDPAGIRYLYRSGNPASQDTGYAVYLATECTDAPWPSAWSTWREDNDRVHRKAPYLTWANAWYNAPCRTWPAPAGPRVAVNGNGLGFAVLLINETLDAATPISGALEVRRRFPTASLVEGVGGRSHAAGLSGVACVDNAIARYLRSGTVPTRRTGNRSDLECGPVPVPAPRSPVRPRLSPWQL